MTQSYSSRRFPYIAITVPLQQRELQFEALVDTGFDGAVVVPASSVAAETPQGYVPWGLADERRVLTPAFGGTVRLGDFPPFPALVIALGEEPILGRQVTDRFRVTLDHGERLTVEP